MSLLAQSVTDLRRNIEQGLDGLVGRMVHGAAPVAPSAAGLAAEDVRIVARVDEFLARGLVLKDWWDRARAAGSFAQRFELGRTFNQADLSFGFFDEIRRGGHSLPVMGNYQEMFYDQPKAPRPGRRSAAEWMRDQVREFVLRYFMRVSDFRQPEGYVGGAVDGGAGLLAPLSWCPKKDVSRLGFGFQQLYYKRRGSGEIGKFRPEERFAIVDLREIGPAYEWIVLKVCIFDFNITFRPFGASAPRVVFPLQEDSYLVVSRDFVTAAESRAPGELGRYGFGYAFVKNVEEGLIAYGPGEFDAAIEIIEWVVRDSGETRVEMAFVANRPERIVNLTFDPLGWAARLFPPLRGASGLEIRIDPVYGFVAVANLASFGLAEQRLCISRQQLEKEFLVKHFMQHYQSIAGSLASWRLVCDWLDEAAIPPWMLAGRSL